MYITSVKMKCTCTHAHNPEVDNLPCRGGSEKWVRTLKSEIRKIMNQCTEYMHILVHRRSLLYQGRREHEWKVHLVQVAEAWDEIKFRYNMHILYNCTSENNNIIIIMKRDLRCLLSNLWVSGWPLSLLGRLKSWYTDHRRWFSTLHVRESAIIL